MKETIHSFGASRQIVGVLTEPAERRAGAPVLVASNVGLNHRVGPNRMWVELARHLASHGYSFFRFDLSGLGDSPARHEAVGDIERAVLDLTEALDYLEGLGLGTAISVSNCSGTDNAHRVATVDPRIKSAVFIDGYSYQTTGHTVRKYTTRWLEPRRWRRGLRHRFPAWFSLPDTAAQLGAVDEIYRREYPTPAAFERDLQAMVARDARLLFVFSGETMTYTYERQFFDFFQTRDWHGRVEVRFLPEANHTFRYAESRRVLNGLILRWLDAGTS